ncbi:unnamed protein product [Arabis nemorensis]|uniref:Uncharacterized protein n=1 Tax=Arabis nemorensis TaxID=586526 RepID=A0A565AYJ6_9BRAS|nr:unnamed protein product [Arabis nemorensis]
MAMAVAPILPQTLDSSPKMSFSTVIRRALSTFATLAFRAARFRVCFRTGAVSAQRLILGNQLNRGSVISFSRFSTESSLTKTTADKNLVSVLESEIEWAAFEEAYDNVLEEKQEGFPFEIIDSPGERVVFRVSSMAQGYQGFC